MPDQPADDLKKEGQQDALSSSPPEKAMAAPNEKTATFGDSTKEEVIPPYAVSKQPRKKFSTVMVASSALILLLMAATLPAAIILVQNQTRITPKAQEEASIPRPRPSQDKRTYRTPTGEEQELDLIREIKPQDLKTETVSAGVEKITFTTQTAVLASISYSPDRDWNYLPLMLNYDEWKDKYNFENLKNVPPINGKTALNEHELVIEGLTSGREYYFAIEIERPGENEVYIFGAEQPGNNYTFTVK